MFAQRLSVRNRLLLLIAAVLVPALLLVSWTIMQLYQRDRLEMERELLTDAQTAARLLDGFMESRRGLLQGLATSQALETGDLPSFHRRAASALPPSADEAIALFSPQGQLILHTRHLPGGALPNNTLDIGPDLLRPSAYVSLTGVTQTEAGSHVIYLTVPVQFPGLPRYVLAYEMSPEVINRLLRTVRTGEDRVIAVVDQTDRVAARNRRADEFVGVLATPKVRERRAKYANVVMRDTNLEGIRSVVALNSSRTTNWTVVVAAPEEQIYASARHVLGVAVLGVTLTTLLSVLLASWLARGILTAIRRLLEVTESVRHGTPPAIASTGLVETDTVAAALSDASRQLTAREAELARSRDEAIEASRAKDEFLATLSHELRTPLNPVLLLASDAAADPNLTPQDARALFSTIAKNVALEARLIDDLLDLTRVSRGLTKLDPQRVDAHSVLRDALRTVELEINEKRLVVAVNLAASNAALYADPARLQQVFWNLFKNATKFTPAGGRIEIRTHNVDDTHLEVLVTDTGIGMTATEVQACFDSFTQGGHSLGGLGLGLAICRGLLQLMGGSISVSSPGRNAGATFTVRIPLAPALPPEEAAQQASRPPFQFPSPVQSILLVEDHEPSRSAVARSLRRRGYVVHTAANVQEALQQFEQQTVDCLISDIGLPDGDGYDLLRQLRERRPDLRSVALTGYGMEEDVQRAREAGFAAHLVKPVNVDALGAALRRLLHEQPAS